MSSYFEKVKAPGIKEKQSSEKTTRVPEGMWIKCPKCSEVLQSKNLKANHLICLACKYHFRMSAHERIEHLTKGASFQEYAAELRTTDPLEFTDLKPYKLRLEQTIAKTNINDAFISGTTKIAGMPVQLGVFEFSFMGGSMGTVVGEKVTLIFETALEQKTPAVIVSSSGGARMQESILSLMQMAKTSALVLKMREACLPFISILTDPTTGGVAASFAMLGDVILAEPNALIGFAGPRVIEQTIRQKLPAGFQRSEFLLEKGFVDQVVPREHLPDTVAHLITMFMWNRTHKHPAQRAEKQTKKRGK